MSFPFQHFSYHLTLLVRMTDSVTKYTTKYVGLTSVCFSLYFMPFIYLFNKFAGGFLPWFVPFMHYLHIIRIRCNAPGVCFSMKDCAFYYIFVTV